MYFRYQNLNVRESSVSQRVFPISTDIIGIRGAKVIYTPSLFEIEGIKPYRDNGVHLAIEIPEKDFEKIKLPEPLDKLVNNKGILYGKVIDASASYEKRNKYTKSEFVGEYVIIGKSDSGNDIRFLSAKFTEYPRLDLIVKLQPQNTLGRYTDGNGITYLGLYNMFKQ